MLQNLPVKNFEQIKDTSLFNKDFLKNYNKESDEECLEVDIQYLKLVLNLSQQKEEETIQYQNQIIILQIFLTENFLAIELRKTKIFMNKPVYSELSILKLNKILMHEFWQDYIKPKYGEKANLCYMDTDSFIAYIKTDKKLHLKIIKNIQKELYLIIK